MSVVSVLGNIGTFRSVAKGKQVKVRRLPHEQHRTAEPTGWAKMGSVRKEDFRGR